MIVKDANGRLFCVAIGISFHCNDQYLAGSPPQYTGADQRGVWRLDERGGQIKLMPFLRGLRNPIGIAFNPVDGGFWATNAGSDDLGCELPRDIFSRLSEASWRGIPWFQYIGGRFQAQSCITAAICIRSHRTVDQVRCTISATAK